jgi:uncharacterized OB-fold protein
MALTDELAAAEPLEIVDGVPRLVIGECEGCGEYNFPVRERCQRCGARVRRAWLPARGILWTWTSQEFQPSSPPYEEESGEAFTPFVVGYVEFSGYLRAEGRLSHCDPALLRIGMPMEVVAVRRGDRLTYAFAPLEAELAP